MRKKILMGFFLLLLTSQVYGLALAPRTVLTEKRTLAAVPEYKAQRLLESSYYKKLAKFLDDRYPYRVPFIISKNWIDFHIFKTSPSSEVIIGTDGWLYYRRSMNDYFKDDCDRRIDAWKLALKLNSMERLLESAGKRFFFIVAPNKATIYPEHVGIERPPNTCGKSFYDLFIEALGEYPLRGFIRLDNLLLEAKKGSLQYYKKGTHWNDRTCALVSKVILERLSTPAREFRLPDMRFEEAERAHDLAGIFSLDLREKSDYAFLINRDKKVWIKDLLPPTVIYRDSFMRVPLIMLRESFEKIDALWSSRVPVARGIDFQALRDSKIVIVEVVERGLDELDIRETALRRALGGGLRYKRAGNKL